MKTVAVPVPPRADPRMTGNRWMATILLLSATVILITIWCLASGITIIFMHLYYFPIILLAYHYRWKGFWLSTALALAYLLLVVAFSPGQPDIISGAILRVLVFIGIAAVIAWLSERFVMAKETSDTLRQFEEGVITNANIWISVLAPDGTLLVWNNAAETISGYKRSEVLGKNTVWKQLYPDPEYRKNVTAAINRIIARDTYLENFETRIRCADGTDKTIAWNTRGMKNAAGTVTSYIAIGRDVTAQKTAEARAGDSERRYQHLFESMQEGLAYCRMIYDADGTPSDFIYLEVNPAFDRMTGVHSVTGQPVTTVFPGIRGEFPRLFEIYGRVARTGVPESFEIDFRPLEKRLNISVYSPQQDHFVAIFTDITERKAAQDRIRELMRIQQEQLRIINTSPAVAFLWKAEENWPVEMVSDNISQFGYAPNDLLSGRVLFSSIVHPDDLARVGAEVAYNSSHNIDEYKQVYRILGPDRTEYWVDDYTHIRRDETGRITHYEGVILDITERRKVEEALEKNRRQLVEAMDLAKQAHWEFDIATGIFTFNDRFYALYGTSAEREGGYEMPAEVYAREFVHPGDGHMVADEVLAAQKTTDPNFSSQVEHRIIRRDGEIRHIVVRIGVTLDEGGRPVKTHGVNQDITDRKMAEIALFRSEQKFREIFDNANDGIEIVDVNEDGYPGRFIDMNAVACRMLRYSKEELLGMGPLDINTDTFSRPFGGILEELKTVGHATFETEHRTKDGTIIPVEINAHMVTILGEWVLLSIVRDITSRKAAEAEIRRSRQLFSDIISFLPDPTFVIDRDGKVLAWNRALEKLSGTPAEDIIGRGDHAYSTWIYGKRRPILIDLVLHPDQDAGRMNYYNIRNEGSTITAETRVILQSGREMVLSLVASPLYDDKGEIIGAIESMRDITRIKETEDELARMNAGLEKIVKERTQALQDEIVQRKYAEQEAQDALAYTRSVIEANPDLMVVLDMEGRILDINAAGSVLTGIPREQLIGQLYFGYLEDDGTLDTAFARLAAEGSIENFVRIRHTGGHRTPLSVHAIVVRGSGGATDRIIVSAHDITRQKADEEAIRASLEEKVILLREIHHRVKNNLQIIISLTNLQMRKSQDPALRQIMAETQNRVRAMSLVHEKLYRSSSLSRIDFADYTRFLASQLFTSYSVETGRVKLEMNMAELMVDIDTAVPLGLIMNELVANALRHAFPGGRTGTLSISGGIADGTLTLCVGDDGVGLRGEEDWKGSGTLGMQLVLGLVDQVGGTMTVESENGTRFTITITGIGEKVTGHET